MSQQPQNQLPDEQTAMANLFDGLHNQVFFNKLAAYGHHANTPQRAHALLELSGKLEAAEQSLQKAGGDAGDPYMAANARLDAILAANGLDAGLKTAAALEAERSLDDVAAQLAQNPVLYNSALRLKAAQAEQIAQQLGQVA